MRKHVLVKVLLFCIIFVSCDSNEGQKNEYPSPKIKYENNAYSIKIIDVDSCEYLLANTGTIGGGISIIHKENCKYCKTRNNL